MIVELSKFLMNILSTFIHFLYTFHADYVYLYLVIPAPIDRKSTTFVWNK